MKKLAVAAVIALSVFNFTETEAATVGIDNAEIVETGPWTKFRDHITGKREREKEEELERERRERERERWEREHRNPPPPPHRHEPPPPPRGHRPPPPPHHR